MTQADHERWERYYLEAVQRDFERAIYKMIDEEDEREAGREVTNG